MIRYLSKRLAVAILAAMLVSCGGGVPAADAPPENAAPSAAERSALPAPSVAVTPTLVAAPSGSVTASAEAAASAASSSPPTATPSSGDGRSPQPEISHSATIAGAPDEFSARLVGTVGDQAIHMQLQRRGEAVWGRYFYDRVREERGAPQFLQLSGSIDAGDAVQLIETMGEEQSGAWDGQLTRITVGDRSTLRFSGTWRDPQGGQSLPFAIAEEPVELGDVRIETRSTEEEDTGRKVTYVARYPQLVGPEAQVAAFNREAEAQAQARLDGFRAQLQDWQAPDVDGPAATSWIEIDYSTTIATDDVISVLFNVYTYFAGAAHPNTESFALNYDLGSGSALALGDLFAADAPYLQTIADVSQAQLRQNMMATFVDEGAAPTPENYKSWNIDRDGLIITFDPYQVAPYAAGVQETYISYDDLRGLIKPDGVLARIAN